MAAISYLHRRNKLKLREDNIEFSLQKQLSFSLPEETFGSDGLKTRWKSVSLGTFRNERTKTLLPEDRVLKSKCNFFSIPIIKCVVIFCARVRVEIIIWAR